MKKLVAALLVFGGLAVWTASSHAALTADLTITVTPVGTKSIAIAPASYAFGDIALAVSTVSATAIAVDNDGTVPMTVGFQVTNVGAPWSIAATPTDDTYNLRALFNVARPLDGDFGAGDDLTAVVQQADGTKFAGDRTGQNVPPAGALSTQNLWLRLDMPTTSSVSTQRTIVVQLSAN